jgi:non-heme chloroperoxidase
MRLYSGWIPRLIPERWQRRDVELRRSLRLRQTFIGLFVASCLSLAKLSAASAVEQSPPSWRDPSPHQVRFVTVDTAVRLEVLDWGGSGRPVVFIGCYLTGHVYDNIAPKLTDRFHVYAVTRRGVGASDHPATGYSPQRRADDILEVIDSLKLQKPILVGSSCGGDILHTLDARNPERIGGLMYLDAAEDPTLTMADYSAPTVDRTHLPARAVAPQTVSFPESETRQLAERPLDENIRRAIVEHNRVRPDYARIRVPVVAIYRTMTLAQVLQAFPPKNEQEREAVGLAYAAHRAMLSKWQGDLRAGVPDAKIIELPGANLYMFLSNEADVIRELRAFGASLAAQSGTTK